MIFKLLKCPDYYNEWHSNSELGFIENRYANVKCTSAMLLNAEELEKNLENPQGKLLLVRFFDDSIESRESHDDWNVLTEKFDDKGLYSNDFTIYQVNCVENPGYSKCTDLGSLLPVIEVFKQEEI